MATLKEYFDTDFRFANTVTRNIEIMWDNGYVKLGKISEEIRIGGKISAAITYLAPPRPIGREYYKDIPQSISQNWGNDSLELVISGIGDSASLTKYIAIYIPSCLEPIKWCFASLAIVDVASLMTADFVGWNTYIQGEEPIYSKEHVFIGRVFIYCNNDISNEELQDLKQYAQDLNLKIHFRGLEYAKGREESEKPYAFICHDSRDKDEIAIKIASGLRTMACPVWYDEFSLKVGDNLRESIEKGIKQCKKCILVITPNFLSNNGWTKKEFDSIFTREIREKQDIVLPIWHNVTQNEVYDYSPSLANKFALLWSKEENEETEVIKCLYRKITE